MENSQGIKKLEFNRIQWGTAYFTVPEILEKFKFPQIVKVIVGFYGEDNESTVSADQVLCLHSIKSIEKVRGHDRSGKEFSISLDCQKKVEVCPSNLKDIYENVEELCDAFPRYVRISQGYYDASRGEEILNVGDKLKLGSIEKSKKGEKKLICINQNGHLIVLPKDCVAGFQPVADGKEYYLAEVLKDFSLPLYVRFVEPYSIDKETQHPLGTVCLDRTYTETLITATLIRSNGQHTMVQFSPDVDICLVVCEDTFRKSTDYVNICQSLNQYVDNQNINTKNANEFAFNTTSKSSLETIKRGVLHSNVSKPNSAEVAPPILGLPEAKAILPKPAIPKAKPDPAKPGPRTQDRRPTTKISTSTHGNSQHQQTTDARGYADPNADVRGYADPNADARGYADPITDARGYADPNADARGYADPNTDARGYADPNADARGYADPNAIYEEIGFTGPKYSECRFVENSVYTELDPTYISTNSHEYAKPYAEHLSQSIPVTSLYTNKMPVATPEQPKEEIHQAIAKYPTDLSNLSITDVSTLLHYLGMGNHAEMFAAELVDGDMLTSMNKENLESLNLSQFHVTKLLRFTRGWRPNVQCTAVETQAVSKNAEISQYEL